jgi:hypothetical protein
MQTEMFAPAADTTELTRPLPSLATPPADQAAERAAWELALAAWMRTPEAEALPLPPPGPAPEVPDQVPAEWWLVLPHASDWWM